MRSNDHSADELDLERGLPTTEDDVAALRRAKAGSRMTLEEYLRFLAALPVPETPQTRRSTFPSGAIPFRLET